MEQSKWFMQSKAVWLAIANVAVAFLGLVPPKYQAVATSVLLIGDRIFGGTGPNGEHVPVTILPPS